MRQILTYLRSWPRFLTGIGLLLIFSGFGNQARAQASYCTGSYGFYACSNDYFNEVYIPGYSMTLDDISSCGATGNGYSDETSSGVSVDFEQGGSYSSSLDFSDYYMAYKVYIDFNDDTTFDASEQVSAMGYISSSASSTTGAVTINIPLTAKTGHHRMRVVSGYFCCSSPVDIDACGGYTASSFTGTFYTGDMRDYTVNIVAAPACSGKPTASIAPSGNILLCIGGTENFTGTAGIFKGLSYQWQVNNSGTWMDVPDDTTTNASFIASAVATKYRMRVVCSGRDTSYSNVDTLSASYPSYASIPYFQDFENWQNYCTINDVPDGHWTNHPSYGDSSWRRDDEGIPDGGWNEYADNSWPSNSVSGSHSAKFHAGVPFSAGSCCGYMYPGAGFDNIGNLDLYLDCSGTAGSKELYFYWICPSSSNTPVAVYNNDSLSVLLSTDGGLTFSKIWGSDTTSVWTKEELPIASNAAHTIVRFVGKRNGTVYYPGYGESYQYYDIGLDSVYVAPPCSGMPTAGTISPASPLDVCAGANNQLSVTGATLAGNLKYKWKKSVDGGATWAYTGDTTWNIMSGPIFDSTQFECVVTCANTGDSSVTDPLYITLSGGSPTAASLPYIQSFENWISRCDDYDIPDSSWANAPSRFNTSWRREDQGPLDMGGCWTPWNNSPPSPSSVDGKHCAAIETEDPNQDCNYNYIPLPNGATGNLYLKVDCSSTTGDKALQFYLNNPDPISYPVDSLKIWMSKDNGGTFTLLGSYGTTSGWQYNQLVLSSNSAQTILNFQLAYSGPYTYQNNVGIDLVKVLPPCQDKPTAGTISPVTPCSAADFQLTLTGYTQAGGINIVWQRSGDGKTWNTIPGDTLFFITENITQATYYRTILTCVNSGLSDTSAVRRVDIAPFYVCYCDPRAGANTYTPTSIVNNFSVTKASTGDSVFNVGAASPLFGNTNPWSDSIYVKWDTLVASPAAVPPIYRDSLYNMYITVGNYYSGSPCTGSFCYYDPNNTPVNVYIDMDHSGTYDPNELVLNDNVDPTGKYYNVTVRDATVSDTFRVPDTAKIGVTGMRVLTGYSQSAPISPCGETYMQNQEIDFLVNIDYRPCNGPAYAGTASISDSAMCVGYPYTLFDTTHESHQSNIIWQWQASGDKINWTTVSAADADTVTFTYTALARLYYRLRMICHDSHDTTFSDTVSVSPAPAYACYCYSMATGGAQNDSSDIGAFAIGTYIVNKGGPHLLNPKATSGRTDHTGDIIDLDVDSTYPVNVYQILRSPEHADGRVTMFIDYNNSLTYDIPQERVWTAITSPTDWYISTNITIPDTVITDVPTGMRVILNNNTAPNVPSDDACGVYTSGETQDFVVKFHKLWPATVGIINDMDKLSIYPNPTTGKFTLEFTATNVIKQLQVNINNVTGSSVLQKSYNAVSGKFSTELDMSEQPKGVYFIELQADGQRMIQKLIVR